MTWPRLWGVETESGPQCVQTKGCKNQSNHVPIFLADSNYKHADQGLIKESKVKEYLGNLKNCCINATEFV